MLGHRRTFIGRLWVAALFWVAAALSQIGSMLIFARVVQGLGSAGIMACCARFTKANSGARRRSFGR